MRRSALVVSEDRERTEEWAGWLEGAGFVAVTCPGPHERAHCPRLEADRCVLREAVDVAVVELHTPVTGGPYRGRPERLCRKFPDDGGTIFVGRRGLEFTFSGEPWSVPGILDESTLTATVEQVWRGLGNPSRTAPHRPRPVCAELA